MTAMLQFEGVARANLPAGPLHLAIGMFDGVHLGHRAVIEPAIAAARAEHGVAAVLTFWPHPSALFRPNDPTRLIQTPPAKAEVLGRLGVQAVITERFTREFAAIPAEQFLGWLKERLPALTAVYVGENFRFGHKRLGTPATLAASGAALGIRVATAPRVTAHGEPVSSTRIRAQLQAGEIEAANALLGYPYFADGVVTPGKKLGRTLGFPTLNVPWSPDLKPRFGVYAVRVTGTPGAGHGTVVAGLGEPGPGDATPSSRSGPDATGASRPQNTAPVADRGYNKAGPACGSVVAGVGDPGRPGAGNGSAVAGLGEPGPGDATPSSRSGPDATGPSRPQNTAPVTDRGYNKAGPACGSVVAAVRDRGPAITVPGVANYGLRPTVENTSEPKLEVHVLGPCPFDAGDAIRIEWLHFIRPEMKFSGLEELRAQIARDRDAAATALG